MSIEIEAKMRLPDLEAIEHKLQEASAQWVTELMEVNTYFDTPQGQLKSTDQGLRIRLEQPSDAPPRVVLTYKGPRAHGQLKSRSEVELAVENERDAAQLLAALGYQPVLSFQKRRRRWQLDSCLIELDTLPYLGDFIEIEGPSEQAVLTVRQKLGLEDLPLISASYITMLQTHLREHHIRATRITFQEHDSAAAAS
ncbi:MAG TPA: class IV adenylate cyclase [Phycisphaeraceae bacterium]